MTASTLDARGRSLVAGVWAFRARAEREATVRFERLARQLAAENATAVVVEMAEKAASDEVRHEKICGDIAERYGHRQEGAEPVAAAEIGPRRAPPAERLLHEIVAFCCVTESINAAVMTVSYRLAEAGPVKAAVREILRDEVSHARLGWAHLAAERTRGTGASLGSALPAMLSGTVLADLFATDISADPALAAHGELPLSMRRAIFSRTLEDVVFPGLVMHGVDVTAGREWLAARTGDDQILSRSRA